MEIELVNPEIVDQLDSLAAVINTEHEQCEQAFKRSLIHAFNCGKSLITAKALVPHGEWGEWLSRNCIVSDRMAQNYMRIAKNYTLENLPSGSIRDAIGMLASSKTQRAADLVDRFPWETEPECFKRQCQLFNDDFLLFVFAMDVASLKAEEISDITGRSVECVEKALNPQFADRCKPFRKWRVGKDDDENNNYEQGQTLLMEGCDDRFFSTAYNLERKTIVYNWRSNAWKQAAIVFTDREELRATALINAERDKQKSVAAKEGLEKIGITWGLGMDGMILEMEEIKQRYLRGEVIVEDDWLMYAHFAHLDKHCRQDALWAIGLSEDEPIANWIERGKFYVECVTETHKCWENEIVPSLPPPKADRYGNPGNTPGTIALTQTPPPPSRTIVTGNGTIAYGNTPPGTKQDDRSV